MADTVGPAVQVDTPAVRRLGGDLAHDVQPLLDKALQQLEKTRDILHSNFTTVTRGLSVAYAAAVEYFDPELASKRDHLGALAGTLAQVATNWEEADRKSTVQGDR
jgi:uncharacterized protein YukE